MSPDRVGPDMNNHDPETRSDPALRFLLRFFGTSSLLALIFVAAPSAWMDTIHANLGMGRLPDAPVVGYLARSTSAFYAFLGGLLWVVSFDLPRYRRVTNYLGIAIAAMGVALTLIDWFEGMPFFWKIWEGPFVTLLGLAITLLNRDD